jgi:hypothetical protein
MGALPMPRSRRAALDLLPRDRDFDIVFCDAMRAFANAPEALSDLRAAFPHFVASALDSHATHASFACAGDIPTTATKERSPVGSVR